MADDEGRLRADASANRGRILDVAREALGRDAQASLNFIAKAAGVGAGTLYRHFPTREALLVGVYRKEIDTLVAVALTLLHEHSPLQALRLWCCLFAEFGDIKHGVAGSLHAAISEVNLRDTYWLLVEALRGLLDACEKTGSIRRGADPGDVLTLLSCVLRIPPTIERRAQVNRILTLIFRGLGMEDEARSDGGLQPIRRGSSTGSRQDGPDLSSLIFPE